jgi:hypothetical protein
MLCPECGRAGLATNLQSASEPSCSSCLRLTKMIENAKRLGD